MKKTLEDCIAAARESYRITVSDPWRCDFCESGCDCDELTLNNYAGQVCEEFPEANFAEVRDKIADYY